MWEPTAAHTRHTKRCSPRVSQGGGYAFFELLIRSARQDRPTLRSRMHVSENIAPNGGEIEWLRGGEESCALCIRKVCKVCIV